MIVSELMISSEDEKQLIPNHILDKIEEIKLLVNFWSNIKVHTDLATKIHE